MSGEILRNFKNDCIESKKEISAVLALGAAGISVELLGFGARDYHVGTTLLEIEQIANNPEAVELSKEMVNRGIGNIGIGIAGLLGTAALTKEYILDKKKK